jgi:hypothetical protein
MAALNYNIAVSGDCFNNGTGAFNLFIESGTPPYTVEFITPSFPTQIVSANPASLTNLQSNVYQLRVNDSTLPVNNEFYINIMVLLKWHPHRCIHQLIFRYLI